EGEQLRQLRRRRVLLPAPRMVLPVSGSAPLVGADHVRAHRRRDVHRRRECTRGNNTRQSSLAHPWFSQHPVVCGSARRARATIAFAAASLACYRSPSITASTIRAYL